MKATLASSPYDDLSLMIQLSDVPDVVDDVLISLKDVSFDSNPDGAIRALADQYRSVLDHKQVGELKSLFSDHLAPDERVGDKWVWDAGYRGWRLDDHDDFQYWMGTRSTGPLFGENDDISWTRPGADFDVMRLPAKVLFKFLGRIDGW